MRFIEEWFATLQDFAEYYQIHPILRVYFPMIYYCRIGIRRRIEGLLELKKKVVKLGFRHRM